MSLFQFWCPQCVCPAVGLLGHMAVLFPVFYRISIVAVPIYISTNSARGFPFLHTLSSTYCLSTFGWWPFWPMWGDTIPDLVPTFFLSGTDWLKTSDAALKQCYPSEENLGPVFSTDCSIISECLESTEMAESEEELKSLLMKVKVESEKVGLSSTFRKRRSWHLAPSLHGK